MTKTVVLASGGGTNFQTLIDAKARGELPDTELVGVISSSPDAYALTRAKAAGIPCHVVDKRDYRKMLDKNDRARTRFTNAIVKQLEKWDADLVVTAGFLYILTPQFAKKYSNRIINIHPSLLPSFGGKGCYGLHVHEKVLEYGVKVTGATAHFLTPETDEGPIIVQKAVEVLSGDTPESLQLRVMQDAEWQILPQAVALFCSGKLSIEGRIVTAKADSKTE